MPDVVRTVESLNRGSEALNPPPTNCDAGPAQPRMVAPALAPGARAEFRSESQFPRLRREDFGDINTPAKGFSCYVGLEKGGYSVPKQGDRIRSAKYDPEGAWVGLNAGLKPSEWSDLNRYGKFELGIPAEGQNPFPMILGNATSFSGKFDVKGVTSDEKGALSGKNLRGGGDDIGCAIRANYIAELLADTVANKNLGKKWWDEHGKILFFDPNAPGGGQAIVCQVTDWGPHAKAGKVIDLTPGAIKALGYCRGADRNASDRCAANWDAKNVLLAFATDSAPLGRIDQSPCAGDLPKLRNAFSKWAKARPFY